jgi:NAD(P)-dependent dehydrogenase (short-subunit alcohol dehydrogenase family)
LIWYNAIIFSEAGLCLTGMGAYAASKAGLNAITSSLAAEVIDFNITVNALLPTIIDTPANRAAMPTSDPARWVLPEQLAEIAYSLSTPWGDPISGALIPVSGRV